MIEPDDNIPPDEMNAEIEMGVEEFLGRPMAGKPEERIQALEKRIAYLTDQISKLDAIQQKTQTDPLFVDLRAARRQLAEWQHQNRGRN